MMKRTFKTAVMLLLAAATLFTVASCSDDDNNPGGGGTPVSPANHGRLYGTRWTKVYKDFSMVDEGYYDQNNHLYIHLCTATLTFSTDSTGLRHLSKDVYDVTDDVIVEHFSDTVAHFRYVYNGGDNQYGPGMLYWDNGTSNKFYVQNIGGESIYVEGEDFPDNSQPIYTPGN